MLGLAARDVGGIEQRGVRKSHWVSVGVRHEAHMRPQKSTRKLRGGDLRVLVRF